MFAGEKIRVLIVDDIYETRENVRKVLQFESDVEVVGAVRTGREGIEASKQTNPDVILMDINMPDMDGITATEIIRRNNSTTQIVILSVQGDPNYMRRAMLAGARDFLTKPPPVDELIAAIRRAGKMAREERARTAPPIHMGGNGTGVLHAAAIPKGRIITVYSPKGGVGCTTLAINLAVALNGDDTPVAIVDGNLQFGDVSVFLNEHGKTSIADLAPRADELDPEFLEEVMLTHTASKVKILTAPSRPEYAEDVNGEQFAKILEYLRRLYRYIIVDVSSSLSDITLTAIDSSDVVILVTTQDIPSIKSARLFFDLTDALKIDRHRVLFMMNRFDKRIGITPEKVSYSFKREIVAVVPSDERAVIPSINRGVPFMLGDRARPIAKSILALATVIRERLAELTEVEVEKEAMTLGKLNKR